MKKNYWLPLCVMLFLPIAANADSAGERIYESADRRALMTPESVTTSVYALASYLTRPFVSDEEKARAIFRWVTENIRYDVQGYLSGRPSASEAGDVLRTRSSVCEGYSTLFEALGKAAGLNVATIYGYAKGYGYHAGDALAVSPNHAWNAVNIKGEWKLIDCTWGAGCMNFSKEYRKEFNSYYFFTRPEEFIYGHLPEDKRWQLLAAPITKQDFLDLPFTGPEFFQLGLNRTMPRQALLNINSVDVLCFPAEPGVFCNAELMQSDRSCPNAVLVQKNGSFFNIRVLPPAPGEYTLHIYARAGDADGIFSLAVGYKILASTGAAIDASYPTTYAGFIDHNVQLHSPLTKQLPSGSVQLFSLTAPGAGKLAVVCGTEWDFLKQNGGQFEGYVEIGRGSLGVYAQYPGKEEYQQLLEYEGTGTIDREPGPVKYQQYLQTEAEVIEPLKKILAAGSSQFFKIKMPGAQAAGVLHNGEFQALKKTGEFFEGTVTVPAGKNIIVGIYNDSSQYNGLLEYEAK